MIKEKIIEYDELLTLEAIQLKEQIDELLKDATLFSRNKNNKREEEQTCCWQKKRGTQCVCNLFVSINCILLNST